MLGLLGWIADRLPHTQTSVITFLFVGVGAIFSLPPALAFVGALKFGRRGGVAALTGGWVFAIYAGGSMMALFSDCRLDHRCDGAHLFHSIGEFLGWAGMAVLATLPWQIAWVAVGAASLYAGLRVRRRKLSAA